MSQSWNVMKMLRWMAGFFEEKGIDSPRLDAEWLLAHVLGMDRVGLYMNHDRPLSSAELDTIRPLVKKRAAREPLQYLLGFTEFWSRRFEVTPAVLIPRPDTEILVEEALRVAAPSGTLLDVGTGSGAIVISLAGELPAWQATGLDVSAAALEVAARNVRLNQLEERVGLIEGDLAHLPEQQYDLIVSNPPYIAATEWDALMPEVRCHEPRLALLAEHEGLYCYEQLTRQAPQRLNDGGWLLLEIGCSQGQAVQDLCRQAGLSEVFLRHDYSGLPRVVGGRYIKKAN